MLRIGMGTIGWSPRPDLASYFQDRFGRPVEILQGGVLDGLSRQEIAELGPIPDDFDLVAGELDGSPVRLSLRKTELRMQLVVDDLVERGAELVFIVCGRDWGMLKSPKPIVNSLALFTSIITSLSRGRRLGLVLPMADQVEFERKRYEALGIETRGTSASPYPAHARLDSAREAGAYLKSRDVDLVWMSCFDIDEEMRAAVASVVKKPVLIGRSLMARVVAELLAAL